MQSLRSSVVGALPLVMLATLAACGGGQASTSSQATATQAASSASEPTETEEASTPSAGESAGGSGSDVQAIADQLKPPNATQTFNSTSGDVVLTIYSSTDSADSLKSFYEGAIPGAGLKVISTSTANDTVVFVFSRDDNTSFGGGVSIGPDPSGGAGTVVSVTVGSDQLQ